jgi:hypothetical protein
LTALGSDAATIDGRLLDEAHPGERDGNRDGGNRDRPGQRPRTPPAATGIRGC